MPWNKTDRSFKTLINKRVTDSDAKFYFNEKGDFTINTHQLELWVDAIPGTAPGATTDIVEYYNTLTLVEDTSVPTKQTWFATSNSSTVPAQTDETSRLKNWVSDKYGSTYEIVLYDTSNVQIPPSDGCGWFFDYQTGILTFTSTTTTTGGGGSLSSRAPFKIKGYRYVGRTGVDGNIIKNEVRVATTPATSFAGWSYASELIDTGITSASLSIDGISLNTTEGLTGDRILIKNWSTLSNNGIYYVERAGDGASDTWRFRRAPDFNDTQDVFPGTMVFVRSGTVNARTVWSMSNASFTTLDAVGVTGEITFAQFITATTRWSALTAPDANLSLAMSTYTTTFNWPTGTGSNNLLSLTTDASANGTGVLLNIATGASSTVVPFRVRRDTTDYLTVNATGGVLIGNLTSGRVTYAGTSGLLQDSANLTFNGNRLSLPTTGSSGGLLIGGDANLYRSASDVLATDDHFNLAALNSEIRLTNNSAGSGGLLFNSNMRMSAHINEGFLFSPDTYAQTSGERPGLFISVNCAPASTSSALYYGIKNDTYFNDDSGTNFTGEIAGSFNYTSILSNNIGSHTLNRAISVYGQVSYFDLNGGSGAILSNAIAGYFLVNDSFSGARITNATGVYIALGDTSYSANGQSRYGLYISGMPDPGSYTGTTTAAIYLAGGIGSRNGIWFGSDTNLYLSASNTLKTDDSFVVGANLSVLNAGTFSLYESGSVNFSSFAAGTQANDLRYTLPTSQPIANQILSATSVSGTGPYDITLGWTTPATSGLTIGDGITGSTVGSVLFVGAGSTLAQDNANLFWDDTNNTLGIGTTRTGAISGTNPSVRIKGTGTTSGTSSFEVQDSTGNTIVFARNDRRVGVGTNAPAAALQVNSADNPVGIFSFNDFTVVAIDNISPVHSAGGNVGAKITGIGDENGGLELYGDIGLSLNTADSGTVSIWNDSALRAEFTNSSLLLYPYGTSAGNTYEIIFYELSTNGSNTLSFKAPDSIGTTITHVLPSDVPATGEVLKVANYSAGVATLEWAADATASGMTVGGTVSGGTTGSVLFVGTGPVLAQDNANFFWDDANNYMGVGTSTPAARLNVSGAQSSAAWGASGILFRVNGVTLTDTTSSGTITNVVGSSIAATTFAASNSTTYTHAATLYMTGLPAAGTNVAITNAYTLWVNNGAVRFDDYVGIGTAPTSSRLTIGGGLSASAWGTTGLGLRVVGGTFTDTSSSGTVASVVSNSFGQPTFAASNSTTFTNAATLYIGNAPTAGTNVTITNTFSMWVNSGISRFDDGIQARNLTSGRVTYAGTSGLLQDSANMTFDGNRLSLATTGVSGGLLIGGDANLYRSAADTLRTDDSLVVGVNLTVSSLTSTRVTFASTGGLLADSSAFTFNSGTGQLALSTTGSSAGILIGGDANLYRSASNILKTDDAFEAVSFNKLAITAPATSATLTIADGATLTVSASATIQNGNHSNTNTGDETVTTIHNKVGYTNSFLLMGA